ncbi:hypothetical protein MILUP08_41913 [Micromonospora lupini str. Lupac 08]|uniref:Uncharacterized protein n=1 Tax=Micromonospora lupini str. Lupac 08 TaxID=1150864 RepID=I0KZJ8_9ACTN|nr:hypothetical protein MILUP08_41913 [Micromonospora lupini str. Lupac 08]
MQVEVCVDSGRRNAMRVVVDVGGSGAPGRTRAAEGPGPGCHGDRFDRRRQLSCLILPR